MSLPEPFGTIERALAAVSGWRLDRRLRRALARAPHLNVVDLTEDVLARIRGHVKPLDGHVLEAPLSARPCVYWALELARTGEVGMHEVLATEQSAIPFLLQDAGHRAAIDPAFAEIAAVYDYECASIGAYDADLRQRAVLGRHMLSHHAGIPGQQLRYRESVIAVDQAITVLGRGIAEPDPAATAAGYRDAGMRIRLAGSRALPLMISDDPRSW